jgi:hypothetical protein
MNLNNAVTLENRYEIECHGPDGQLKWVETIENLVTTEGLNDLLTKYLKGSTYSATWFVGLTDGTPTTAAGDTLASHAGWVEVTAYTGNRQTLTLGTASAGSIDNSASKATFAITGTATIGGAFVASAATGTSGILYGVGAFTGGDKSCGNGDSLTVTCTLTAAAA